MAILHGFPSDACICRQVSGEGNPGLCSYQNEEVTREFSNRRKNTIRAMGYSSQVRERMLRRYRSTYGNSFEGMLESASVGGRDHLKKEIQSENEARHRAACETLNTIHEISRIKALKSLGHLEAALSAETVFNDLLQEVESLGTTLEEMHLQHNFVELEKIEMQIAEQMSDITQGFTLGHRRNRTDPSDFPMDRLEYRFYFSMYREAQMNKIRLSSMKRQTEDEFAHSFRHDEISERIEIFDSANNVVMAHLWKTVSNLPWKPGRRFGITFDEYEDPDP